MNLATPETDLRESIMKNWPDQAKVTFLLAYLKHEEKIKQRLLECIATVRNTIEHNWE